MKVLAAALLLAFPHALMAADHLNLEEGLPTALEDAYPVAYRGPLDPNPRELRAHGRWQRPRHFSRRSSLALPGTGRGKLPFPSILASRRLGADTVLVADYLREQEAEEGKTIDLIELGVRRQLNPFTVLSAGVGAGLSRGSPDFRLVMGFQKSF